MKTTIKVLVGFSMVSVLTIFPLSAQSNTPDSGISACGDGQCNNEIITLHRMARWGSFEAMTLLSMVYATGDGREADPEKALSYLERAVNHRYPLAIFLMSDWYRQGFVVAQDLQKADMMLDEAVKLGLPSALYRKALQLLQQQDETSITAGITLLEQASENRLFDAMFLLARLKQQGAYTPVDLEGAAQLFKNLVLSGHEESRPFLQQAITELTPKPEAAELVADLQQSYDIEVIQVVGHDFTPVTALTNTVRHYKRLGLYIRGSISRIRTVPCDGSHGCYTIEPQQGDRDLKQTLTGQP